jgi:hypothetical protein
VSDNIPERYTRQAKQARAILDSENGGLGDDEASFILKIILELGDAEAALDKITYERLCLLSRRFNSTCNTPGVTSATQDEIEINDWLKYMIARKVHKAARREND